MEDGGTEYYLKSIMNSLKPRTIITRIAHGGGNQLLLRLWASCIKGIHAHGSEQKGMPMICVYYGDNPTPATNRDEGRN